MAAVHTDLTYALEDALRAPSVHNTQPWRWRIRDDSVELYSDWTRHLVATDPDRRDLVVSCGAALHHLRVALAARGLAADVERMPDPEDRRHLATVTARPGGADLRDADLYPGIAARRTDRRRMSHRRVPAHQVHALVEQAARAGAVLLTVTDSDTRARLVAALSDAAQRQRTAPGYAAELYLWTHRYPGGHDGVPAGNVAAPPVGATGWAPLRRYGTAGLDQPHQRLGEGPPHDAAELLAIGTPRDTVLDRLRAGEATSAVLLAATRMGLATTPLSQAIEVDVTRRRIQREVLHVPEVVQLVIRVGLPATGAAELPETPRRPLHTVLLPG